MFRYFYKKMKNKIQNTDYENVLRRIIMHVS